MKFHSFIPSRTAFGILCGMTLAAGVLTSPAKADQWDKRTILTVNQTIQVTDTVLEPGQYVLRLLESPSNRHVVQIFNRDQTHIINTVLAIPRQRLEPTGHTAFTFWETPPGTTRALRTWFYPGDSFGQEFPYPKHLQQVAMLMPPPTPVAAPEPPPATPEPAPAAEPQPQSEATPPPAAQEQPAEVAQNTTPPAAEPPQPQSTPSQPTELPKTGSPYPLIGIGGVLLMGLAGLLRLKRAA